MFILTIVVAFVVLIFVAFEFSIIVTYGMPIKKRKLDELMLKLEDYHLNPFDETILSCPVSPYITTVSVPICFKYYVNGYGVIWRFSKYTKGLDDKLAVCAEKVNVTSI